jgi:hypothetical protein
MGGAARSGVARPFLKLRAIVLANRRMSRESAHEYAALSNPPLSSAQV